MFPSMGASLVPRHFLFSSDGVLYLFRHRPPLFPGSKVRNVADL